MIGVIGRCRRRGATFAGFGRGIEPKARGGALPGITDPPGLSAEPMTGIAPAYSAWEVFSTPEQVSANCLVTGLQANAETMYACGFSALGY